MLKGKVSDLLGWVSSRLGILKFFWNRKVFWLTRKRPTERHTSQPPGPVPRLGHEPTWAPQKVALWEGKSRLVKYEDLARLMDFFGDFPGDLEVPEKRGEGRSLSISNFWDSEGLALWTQQHQMKMVVNWDFQGLFIRIRFIEMLQYLYCIGLYIARNFGICMEIVAFVVLGPRRFSHEEWLIFSNLVDPFWLWTAGRSWKPFIQGWKLIVVIGKRQHLTNFAGRLFRHAIWAASTPPREEEFIEVNLFAGFSPIFHHMRSWNSPPLHYKRIMKSSICHLHYMYIFLSDFWPAFCLLPCQDVAESRRYLVPGTASNCRFDLGPKSWGTVRH